MTSPSANVTDVVFDFCGVLIDWQTRACLEGRYPQVVVDRICADNDPCGFYDYEDRMDHGEDFEDIYPDVVREQGEELTKRGIDWQVVPGVSAFLGAAAELGVEYTVPEVSQSLIITRLEGRTPVPEREQLESFASHQTSMAIYLSVQRIHRVAERLIEGGYPADTPVAVVYKATWPESMTVRGTLTDIAEKVRAAGIRKTALILVGAFLGDEYHFSRLYDAGFSHEYRNA